MSSLSIQSMFSSSSGILPLLPFLLGELDLDLDRRSGLEEGDLDRSRLLCLGLREEEGGVESITRLFEDEGAEEDVGAGDLVTEEGEELLIKVLGESCFSCIRGFRFQSKDGCWRWSELGVRIGIRGSSLLWSCSSEWVSISLERLHLDLTFIGIGRALALLSTSTAGFTFFGRSSFLGVIPFTILRDGASRSSEDFLSSL